MTTTREIAALRDDLEMVIADGNEQHRQARSIANRCIHLMVLHGILPEQPVN